jgi:ATP-dependent DNA ligase
LPSCSLRVSLYADVPASAVRQLPAGVVLDGELVILGADGRLSFDAL